MSEMYNSGDVIIPNTLGHFVLLIGNLTLNKIYCFCFICSTSLALEGEQWRKTRASEYKVLNYHEPRNLSENQ